jgi:hypothetical protein
MNAQVAKARAAPPQFEKKYKLCQSSVASQNDSYAEGFQGKGFL